MAVSYHQLTSSISKAWVKIYAHRISTHHLHGHNKFENEKVYEVHSIVDNPDIEVTK